MPCYHPIPAHQSKGGGKPQFGGSMPPNIKLPCGRCIGCRLERSKQWAIRIMHEAQLHQENSFITLTFDNEHLSTRRPRWEPTVPLPLPQSEGVAQNAVNETHAVAHAQEDSLSKRDAQLFVKRLRKRLATQTEGSARIKYYFVGEYGDKNGRPHYHAAIFGTAFTGDRYPIAKSPTGQQLYRSPTLEALWPYGYSSIGELTFESAAYIARYVMKKVNGKQAETHYRRTRPDGTNYWITPEFALMSRGGREGPGGIGKRWFDEFGTDLYPHDYVVMNGSQHKPPRYYDQLLAKVDLELATLLKLEREFTSRSKAADNTPARLAAKEKVAQARAKQSKRNL